MLIIGLLLAGWLAAGEPKAASAPAAPAPQARYTAQQIDALLAQLSHPRFAVREGATQELIALDAEYLPELVRRYRAEIRYEPKRRIRYVVEYIFHRDQIIGRNGFLGIVVWPSVLPDLIDPVNGKTTRGVVIKDVKAGFAGERSGLRPGDVLIAQDDQPLPEGPTTEGFIKSVSANRPGTKLTFRVLRVGAARNVTVEVAAEPLRTLGGAKFEYIMHDDTAQAAWIASVQPGSAAAAAGLRANELIRSIDGNRITFGPNQLEGLLRGSHPGRKLILEVLRTEAISIPVRLGSRPPEYISDLRDKQEAQARFLEWWQQQGGDLSGRQAAPAPAAVFPGDVRARPEAGVIP